MGNVAMDQKEKEELVLAVAREIAIIKSKIDSMKEMYSKLDELTLALKDLLYVDGIFDVEIMMNINESLVFDGKLVNVAPQYIKVVDNFATRNTVFRNTAVKRFEVFTETVTERAARNLK